MTGSELIHVPLWLANILACFVPGALSIIAILAASWLHEPGQVEDGTAISAEGPRPGRVQVAAQNDLAEAA
jgi:hypothetical protein